MKLDAIHHVAIIVSDYRRSREFYVDKLGFRVIRENYRQDRGDWKLDLACGDIELEIFARPRAPERPTRPEALGLRHIGDVTVQPDNAATRGKIAHIGYLLQVTEEN